MPQETPTVQSTVADPNFQKLNTDDRIAVLSHLDSNFKGLKPDVQLEVLSHLMERTGTQATMSPPPPPRPVSTGNVSQKSEQTVQHGIMKEGVREALPYVGGAAASLLAGPEAGIPTRMLLAGLGGGAGSVTSHAIPGGTQPPLLSGAGAIDVAEDAAKQATAELGGWLAGKGIGALVGRVAKKVPVEEAAAKIADSIHPQITPAEFGDTLRNTLATVRNTLGEQKGQILDNIASKFQPTQPNFLNTRFALNNSIAGLEAERKLTPSLFQAGEAKAKTLAVLNDIKNSIDSGNFAQPGQSVIRGMDDLRSNLFKLGQGMDRSLPKNMVGQLTHAVHDDLGATLGQFGPDGKAAFQQFENASAKFRETADVLDTATFKRIMKANVNQPEKVLNILMQAPETNVEGLSTILKNSPNGAAIQDSMKHLALEKAASSSRMLDSIPEPARQVVFGSDLPNVEKFFEIVRKSNPGTSMLQQAALHTASLAGTPGAMVANWIIRSGNQTATISSAELAALLGNPSTLQKLIRAAQTSPSEKAAALIFRALGTYAEMPTAPQQPAATPIASGATIGQQLQSKGMTLPMPAPNAPGLPFHPGAGL